MIFNNRIVQTFYFNQKRFTLKFIKLIYLNADKNT